MKYEIKISTNNMVSKVTKYISKIFKWSFNENKKREQFFRIIPFLQSFPFLFLPQPQPLPQPFFLML